MIKLNQKIKINKKTIGKISNILSISKKEIKYIASVVLIEKYDKDCEITFVFCDDKFIQKYNKNFRNKDKPTNVLSFPSDEFMKKNGYLGDILISVETINRESLEYGKDVKNHAIHMIVHSILHLLGYDHVNEIERCDMEDLEIKILEKFGIQNPYFID